jgi:hypothetical protein
VNVVFEVKENAEMVGQISKKGVEAVAQFGGQSSRFE